MRKFIILAVMTVFCFIVFSQTDSYKNKNRAYIIAQDFVKKKLNHPKDAKFYSDVVHETNGYSNCIVLGKVDARNSYGANTSYVYKIWLNHNGKEWTDINNWVFTKLIIENSDTQKQSVFYK